MTLINADGSAAEMSGNGIRCLAHAELLRRGTPSADLAILTDGGPRRVEIRHDPGGGPGSAVARVEMGPAGPGPAADRPLDRAVAELSGAAAAALGLGATRHGTYDLGNPHLVLLVEDPAQVELADAGPTHEAGYDRGINVHFVAPTTGEADAMDLRVWERGAGITEACGTGATAVARAAHDWGLVGPRVTVHMPGGDVVVEVGEQMVLHGPSVVIAHVEVEA